MLSIINLHPGDKVRLLDFGDTPVAYRRRLLALGLTCGLEVCVLEVAPLGCPVLFDIRGAAVALRRDEAKLLRWERV